MKKEKKTEAGKIATGRRPGRWGAEAPPMDPAMGDKTPAFMRWLKAHDPVEFAKRYKDRVVAEI